MKKILKLAAVAASVIALFSCQKEVEQVTEPQAIKSFTFNVAHEGVDTKSSLNDDHTAFQWENDDVVGVYFYNTSVDGNANLQCPVVTDGTTATITVIPVAETVADADIIYGYYPYNATDYGTSAVTAIIPTEQNGESIVNAMPMYSTPINVTVDMDAEVATNQTMYFNNLAGVLQFNVYSTEAEYRSEVVKSVKFQKEGVSGTFYVDIANATPALYGNTPSATDAVTAKVTSTKYVGESKAAVSTLVYMVVAPNNYNGAVVTVTTDKAIYTATLTSDLTVAKNQVIPFNINLANTKVDREATPKNKTIVFQSYSSRVVTDNFNKEWVGSEDCTSNQWPADFNATGATYRGACFGTSATLTSKQEYPNVSKIVVECSSNGNNNTISVSVGGTKCNPESATLLKDNHQQFTFTSATPASGAIEISINKSASSIWIGGVILNPTDIQVEGISLDKTEVDLPVGQNLTLTATITPDNATNKSVTWSSSDANVATVDEEGVVTAVAVGKATITATTVDGEFTATCEVTVTNAFTSIQSMFDAATVEATEATVVFDNWIVSGVKNRNAYVTDNNGKGFMIYESGHGFNAGDILSGKVNCKLQLYNGFAELTGVTSSSEGITVTSGGTVEAKEIAITELSGVNTGALLYFSSLVYNGSEFSDGSNTIKPYNSIMSTLPTFVKDRSYEVTGIYIQYNTTKEIAPRSESDIVAKPYFTATANTTSVAAAGGTVTITVDTNVDGWTASSSDNTNFAITTEGNTVTVTVAENTGEERTGIISFTVSGLSPEPITITQANPSAGGGLTKGDQWSFESNNKTSDSASWNKIVGNSSNSATSIDPFENKSVTLNSMSWLMTATSFTENGKVYFAGQTIGSSGNDVGNIVLSTTSYSGGIETITIESASNGTTSLAVYVNDVQIGETKSLTSSKATYTFSPASLVSGTIRIEWSCSTAKKNISIYSIQVN